MEVGYLLCLLAVLIYPLISYGQGNCVKKNDCVCQFSDGTRINLEPISKKGSFAFPYQKEQSGGLGGYEYAYNPCFPVTDTENCTDVAGCQKDPNTDDRYSIGDATSAKFLGSDDSITIGYSSVDQHGTDKYLTVTLVCDKSATTPNLKINGESPQNNYQYTLTSECCCPGGCDGGPPPPTGGSGGLSLGSILCITFTCLVAVYLISGVIFMKFVKHAEGKEVIPNYSFWTDLPALIKGGCMFTYAKFSQLIGRGDKSSYDSM